MKHRLVIEVDGGQHNFNQHHARDVRRDGKLTSEGFRVLDSGTAILIAICLACRNQSTTP
jgi:very-short-patch-repair endonuclease